MYALLLLILSTTIWGLVLQVSRAETNNYIQQYICAMLLLASALDIYFCHTDCYMYSTFTWVKNNLFRTFSERHDFPATTSVLSNLNIKIMPACNKSMYSCQLCVMLGRPHESQYGHTSSYSLNNQRIVELCWLKRLCINVFVPFKYFIDELRWVKDEPISFWLNAAKTANYVVTAFFFYHWSYNDMIILL